MVAGAKVWYYGQWYPAVGNTGDPPLGFVPITFQPSVNTSTSALVTVNCTTAATAHTPGAWVQVTSFFPANVDGLRVSVAPHASNGVDTSLLLDVGVGGSGSEVTVAENILVGYAAPDGGPHAPAFIDLPVSIAAGQRLAMRVRGAQTSASKSFHLSALQCSRPTPTSLVTFGANTSTSSGVVLTAPANVNVKSAWTEITASTPVDLMAVQLLVTLGPGNTNIANNVNRLFDLGIGSPGSEQVIVSNVHGATTNSEGSRWIPSAWYVADFPAGIRLAVRYQASSVASDAGTMAAVVIGVPYP
jgi:hypothetical protein